jgi:uncharacterized protein YbjT (DUF2867 family)
MSTTSHTVLVVGAAGWLGRQIVTALAERGTPVRVMLRGGANHPAHAELARIATVVDGDLTDPASLDRATRGVHTIVSAVQGGPDVIVQGQVALAAAGLANGVARIIPSDFSIDLTGVDTATHLFLGWRAEADRQIAALGLPQVNVLNGAFAEVLLEPFFGLLDLSAGEVAYWGDADQPYDFTLTADVAHAVAALASDPSRPAGPFHLAGDTRSPRQIAQIAASVTGRPITLNRLGTLADLDATVAQRQQEHPDNPLAWAGLQYHRLMANGSGQLRHPEPIPGLAPTGIEAFLRGALAGQTAKAA